MSNPGLTRAQWIGVLAALTAVFLFAEGPIWRHPWDVDRAAWWSYLPIPFVVAGCLAWTKRLRWPALLVDTIGVTMAKFAITYVVAIGLWIASGGPPPRPALAATAFGTRPAKAHRARTRVAAETGDIAGRVVGPDGAPRAGALVWIAGLAGYRFAAAREPLELVHDEHGFTPSRGIVEVGQPIVVRATDGRLHTLHAKTDDGRPVFNIPVLPGGAARPFVPRDAFGLVRIDCTVHASQEAPGWLVVTGNPFHAATANDGRFRFDGVPVGRVTVLAWSDAKAALEARVTTGRLTEVTLALR